MAQNQNLRIYAYTQHESTIKTIETVCNVSMIRLQQDRTKDPVEDVLSQIPLQALSILYAVLPIDKAIELQQKAPWLKIRLLQLDGKVVEQLTGRPYDPKAEYPAEVVMKALKVIEIRGGNIRYIRSVEDLFCELNGKRVSVFNDALRETLNLLLNRLGKVSVELVKTCDQGCVEINPLGYKSGYRVSFPGAAGRLTPQQMADMIERGEARIYYAEITAEEVPLCP